MYWKDYRDLEQARESYAALEPDAAACLSCSGAPCSGACPVGLEIASLTRDTHRALQGSSA